MYKTAQIFKRTAATLMLMSLALTLFVANIASVNADAATINSFEVVQGSFNPSDESAEITFSLNTSGKIGLEIHEGSNPIKTLAMRQDVTAGSHTYYWDGTNDSGEQVPDGTYKAQLLFYGSDFALFADDMVTVDFGGGSTPQPIDVITNDYAYPQQFDPRLEITKIYFTLNDSVDELNVEIEKNGSHVVTLIGNQSKSPGTYYATWNGRNKHNVIVGEGEYRYVITASGDFGSDAEYGYIASNYGSETGISPNITGDYASPSTFDPQNESTKVYYTLNTGADLTVEIYDGSMLVDILLDHEEETSGTHSVTWDGRNLNGDLVSEDTYTYKVYAENAWGDDMESGSVTVDYESNNNTVVTPNVTNTYASPDEFDPTEEDTTITYTLNTCAYITAKVYKKSNNAYVTTLEEVDYQCEGNHSLKWDGRDDDNDIVENGQYTIEVSAHNSKGSDKEEDTVTVYDSDNDGDGPNVYDMEVDPEEFDPYETTTKLSFRLDECADTTVRVYDDDDDLVNELRDEVYWCSGTHSVVWDGEDDDNDEVDEGDYYFKVIAENENGYDTEKIWVEVDYDSSSNNDDDEDPEITRVDVDPERFDPYEEEAELSFELNTCAYVTIEVRDDDNDLVYEIIDDKWLCEGDHDYDWDGEDEDNDYVRQDDYEFYIRAENSYGTDIERADVEVDYNGHTVDEEDRCAGYLDVSANDPYCEAIEYVKGAGIFDGYPDGYFRPYQAINRAETTKVIVRAFDYPELPADGTNLGFWDLSPWDWYMGYIRTAKQYGIIQGYPDGSFKPAQTVNRVELLKIFLESAKVALPTCAGQSYPDTMANVWYSDYVCYAKMHNLMDTDYYGMFNPAKPMTRGDVAELFYRYSERNLGDNNYYYDDYYNDYEDSPRVYNIRLSDYIVEEGDGFRIYYTLNEGAEVTVEILDDDKDEIRTLLDELYRSSGEHSVYFDGEDDYDDELSEDQYFVRIEAENRNGRYKVDIKFEVDNDADGVRITSLELSDDEFDPDYEDVEISFRITEDAEVTVRIYDEDNDFVTELWDDRDRNEGNHYLEWDGRDDYDNQVSDGEYTIKVIADDGDDTDTEEIEVEVNS